MGDVIRHPSQVITLEYVYSMVFQSGYIFELEVQPDGDRAWVDQVHACSCLPIRETLAKLNIGKITLDQVRMRTCTCSA